MLVEEAAVPAAHVAVGEEVAFPDAEGAEVGQGGVKAGCVDVAGRLPVVLGYEVVGRAGGRGICRCGLGSR